MNDKLIQWRNKEGRHLPEFLRMSDDQYNVALEIWTMLQKQVAEYKQKGHFHMLKEVTPEQINVLLIDHILWFLARHGYTLQKCRVKEIEFDNIWDTIAATDQKHTDARNEMLAALLGGNKA